MRKTKGYTYNQRTATPEGSPLEIVKCGTEECKAEYLRGTYEDNPPGRERYCHVCGKFSLFQLTGKVEM